MKFRKRPVVIDAEQFWPQNTPWPEGVRGGNRIAGEVTPWWCNTLEGAHQVTPGDWIITGVKGEKYPCKPDIFALTYEAVTEEPPHE